MALILLQTSAAFNWNELLFGKEEPFFLTEIIFRSTVMFLVTLISLRLLGKRGVAQLSVFELIVILTLGSAAGDSMFYKDVGLLQVILVFGTVVVIYRIIIFFMDKSKEIERLVEGTPVYLIKNGRFNMAAFDKEDLAYDEFFAELRLQNVSHLGQVDQAIIEVNGRISLFYYADEDVRFGLPILPEEHAKQLREIMAPGIYACALCGNAEQLSSGTHQCPTCQQDRWVKARNNRRIN